MCGNAAGRVQAMATSMLADLRDMESRHGEDVLGDLQGETFEVQRAERVAREVHDPQHVHGSQPSLTAWDCLVKVVRRT